MTWSLGPLQDGFADVARRLEQEGVARRIWNADASLWSENTEAAEGIRERLGWLRLPEAAASDLGDIDRLVRRVRKEGFTQAILLGMGGSSLAPDVLRRTLAAPDGLRFHVLDSTDPAVVARLAQASAEQKTLFIASSKSGTTAEPLAGLDFFWYLQEQMVNGAPGGRFVVITDPGTPLEQRAVERDFRRVFSGPADVGGRFTALSVFDLLPARLMGVDAAGLLAGGRRMARRCRRQDIRHNPGLALGAALGAAGMCGRDKITLLADAPWQALGDWIEQLIAESSGKDGKGLWPVVGEPLRDPGAYGTDRLFVYIRTRGDHDAALASLETAGMPHIVLNLEPAAIGLGEAFFCWEFAVATACHLLGVNAFDQPHVQSAKQRANDALAALARDGSLPALPAVWQTKAARLSAPPGFAEDLTGLDLSHVLRRVVGQAREGDAVVLLGFLDPLGPGGRVLEAWREAMSFSPYPAVTLGFGPRYLHSTGQLHKGGANNLVVLMVSADPSPDLATPGHPISFGLLERAQAMGDLQALWSAGRRAFGLHVGDVSTLAGLAGAFAHPGVWLPE
jgi:transaldolase/glucose-6-phosphate isomerase